MRKAIAVCAVLGTLLHVLTAAVLAAQMTPEALAKLKYAHLQADIDEWHRLGYPKTAAFMHKDGMAEIAYLVEIPDKVLLGSTNYAANTFFYLFTRESPNGTLVEPNAEAFRDAGWTPKRPTRVIIHGFSNNIQSQLFTDTIPPILEDEDCNVIGVDWGSLCKAPYYIQGRYRVCSVGKLVAQLIESLAEDGGLQLEDLTLIGHSLGAHVAGCAGKNLRLDGKIGRIAALDPAKPLFGIYKGDRLSKSDAALVDVIHTCSGLMSLTEALGHVDFYPNGGSWPQPGCGWDWLGTCSHGRSIEFFTESITEKNAFPARECATQDDARQSHTCSNTTVGNMGFHVKFNVDGTGTYTLQTASSAPFDQTAHRRAKTASMRQRLVRRFGTGEEKVSQILEYSKFNFKNFTKNSSNFNKIHNFIN